MAPFLTPSLPLVANNAVLESCRLPTYSRTLALGGTIPDPLPLVANNAVLESCRLPTYSRTLALGGTIPDPIAAFCCQQGCLRVNGGGVPFYGCFQLLGAGFSCFRTNPNVVNFGWHLDPWPQVVTAILGTMKQLGLAGVASGTSWIFMGPQGQFRTPFHQQNIMGYSNMAMRKSFRNVDDLPLPKCFFFSSGNVYWTKGRCHVYTFGSYLKTGHQRFVDHLWSFSGLKTHGFSTSM